MSISKNLFGAIEEKEVYSYTLTNKSGAYITFLTYGGIINKIVVPDKDGNLGDIACGFDCIEDYLAAKSYFGSLIGRYGNRISADGYVINGKRYGVALNDGGKCHLHGGNEGFNEKHWNAETASGDGYDELILTYLSPDGEEGYPGNLSVKVTYRFDDDNALTIRYEAVSDADTIINLTNHAYFNLNGYDGGSVMEQELFIDADKYDVPDDILIPVGEPASVEGTAFDFRKMRPIEIPFDHNFVLNGKIGDMRLAAQVYDPKSGRTLSVYTDLPAIQLYTACNMNGETRFKGGVEEKRLHAFCLETQYSPNTPNRPYMPQCTFKAGEKYDTTTKYVFSVK